MVVPPTCEATAGLMAHCRNVEAFTYVSSTIVYERLEVGHRHAETDPLGGLSTPRFMPAYSATKLSAEATVRAVSHLFGIPATIARLNLAVRVPDPLGQHGPHDPEVGEHHPGGRPGLREPA